MLVELFNGHMNAALAAEEIYGYIERHDEWDNEELMKSHEYFLEMSKQYAVALECARMR